jgi:hypothetical protein
VPGLERLAGGDVADAAGEHDRLVIATHEPVVAAAGELLVAAEITGQVRAAELVVEGRRADRAFEHDRQRRSDACRAAVGGGGALPGLRAIGNVEVGDRKTAQAGFRLRAATGRAFIADLAARRRSPRPGNGEIAVGWLCVSTLARMCVGSSW